jgi:hypothetical protein
LQQLKENTRAQFDQQIAALQQDLIQLEQMAEVLQCSAPLVPTPTPDAESVPSDCAQVAQRIADDEIMLGKLPANDPAIPALDTDMRRMRQKAQVLNCP